MSGMLVNNKVDPTQSFVDYVNHVKPFHTKILEVDVTLLCNDSVDVVLYEDFKNNITLLTPDRELIRTCGWGIEWDSIKTIEEYPTVNIKQSVGDVYINCSLSTTVSDITLNNDTFYIPVIGDEIVFFSTGALPTTVDGSIIPGVGYFITSVSSNLIQVSDEVNGNPIVFTDVGTGTISIMPMSLEYNSFLVNEETFNNYDFIVSSTKTNECTFVDSYNVTSFNSPSKQWTVAEDLVSNNKIVVGGELYIHGDTGYGVNKKYTINSFNLTNAHTVITVNETISSRTVGDGVLSIVVFDNITNNIPSPKLGDYSVDTLDDAKSYWPIPSWASGNKVRITNVGGDMPIPLSDIDEYFYIPTTRVGKFVLSKKRYPKKYEDIVDISTLGYGIFHIHRSENFYPGASIKVEGSFGADRVYYVRDVKKEGSDVRIGVIQKIAKSTPDNYTTDGTMKIVSTGWDYPDYCPLSQASELYVDGYVSETLSIHEETI